MASPLGSCRGAGVTSRQEEDLLALLRSRVDAVAHRQAGTAVAWERPDRSAERDDLRARLGLDRAAAERLPSGLPWRGRIVKGRFFPRTQYGVSFRFAASWNGLARGDDGAITRAEAIACYEQEREVWRRRFGTKPFYAAVAGVFQDDAGPSPMENLVLLSWKNGAWRFHGRSSQPDLAELFFPRPAEKNGAPARWKGMSQFRERLLSPFRNKHRSAEARLAIRTREFQEAKLQAGRLRDEYELHAAAGDWSEEMLQIQLAKGRHALRQANLLHQQVKSLQENLQLLTTAKMGGAMIADAALPIDEDELASLDRAYFQTQARRQGAVRAERTLAETLLADEPAQPDILEKEEPVRRRLIE